VDYYGADTYNWLVRVNTLQRATPLRLIELLVS
jgi:hypothetical protein